MALIDKIAKQVASALKSAGMTKAATLTVVTPGTRTPGAESAGTNPTTVDYTARGLVIVWKREMLGATVVMVTDRVVMLLGASIASAKVPKVGDTITIEGVTSRIIDIERDPASATYNCLTKK